MRTSMKGIDLIQHFEGFSDVVYVCPAGFKTIGFGHMLREGETYDKISRGLGESILMDDLHQFEEAVHRLVSVDLTQNQFDALVSFTFNLGPGALAKSTLLKKLNQGDYAAAAREFNRWIYAAGKPLKGLVKRRQAETDLFNGN